LYGYFLLARNQDIAKIPLEIDQSDEKIELTLINIMFTMKVASKLGLIFWLR
jgi:hypothetical protein